MAPTSLIVGLGLGFATNAAPLLITELAYPTQRGPITASYNSSWYLGSIVAAVRRSRPTIWPFVDIDGPISFFWNNSGPHSEPSA